MSTNKTTKPRPTLNPIIRDGIELARSTRHLRAWRQEAQQRLLGSLLTKPVIRAGAPRV